MSKNYKSITKFILALCVCVMGFVSTASANVTIDPKRVVFFGRERIAKVNLINSGDKEAVYRVFFQETYMGKDGIVRIHKLGDNPPAGFRSSSHMIRYSPRRVTIPAHSGQVVRISITPIFGISIPVRRP
ncbi:MAG: hypothetical protein GY804_14030 [Alphaproteobacteria bacterium]|nr:hypothetical protein [Alphaproteobacteria bacterium]